MKPEKRLLNEKNVNELINFYKGIGMPFKLRVSNFTIFFESEFECIHYIKFPRGKRFFAAYQKIKSNLNGMPIYINDNYIRYYNTGFIHDNFYADKIFQVDINSCYASILQNNGLITKETYQYLNTLPKDERLSSVGMMASKKNIFEFDNKGKIIKHEVQKSLYSDYFFYCVQETFKIMQECKNLLGNDYLFSWVDAIYFTNENNKDIVMNFFRDKFKLNSSFHELIEFEVEMREQFYRLRYKKENIEHYMNIPLPENIEIKGLLNHLLTKNHTK